ncbi:hypothetical protein BGZ52_007458 [Haplosporangium bisporale]|nr:hypothetical protein BGZ52_007458 [Haplosporangium bisporale]
MDLTHNQTAPSSTAQPSTDIGDDFGDLDEALLSQILDDEDELDLPAKSQTSRNQSEPEQQQTSATSATPVDPPSSKSSFTQSDADESALLSSDDEDLAALEELNRKRAQLEAKLKAKRQKKAAVPTPTPVVPSPQKSSPTQPPPSSEQDSPSQPPTSKQATPQPPPTSKQTPLATTSKESPETDCLASSSQIDDYTTTPTRSPRSPMIRTPSPPSRSRFLMSPPSGAYSRKRHHSPSPLPRRDSFSAPRPNLASTPTSGIASRGIKHNMEAYRTRLSYDKPLTPTRGKATSMETNAPDDPLDDAYLDKVLGDLDPEGSDAQALVQDERTKHPLIQHFEEKGKRRAEEQAKAALPRPTFKSIVAQTPAVSDEAAIERGHTQSYDPLTKLRIGERYQSLGAVVQMTYGQTVLPIKDAEQIRTALFRTSNTGAKAGALGVEVEDPGCLFTLGRSKDFGLCQAVKINNEDCGRILDTRASMYCQHHIMMATNKHRNQRGSLIAGTSSIYDLNKQPSARPLAQPRRTAGVGLIPSRETTYIFDDGGVGTSSMADPEGKKKDPLTGEDGLSSFLMNQNNPGGQYLRQAKVSKDTVWAKDITSPKTPTKGTDSFPAEMIRRMGYDPVSGQFVPGSPKRGAEDPEARERSIRLLAERVKSPPGPIKLMSTMVPVVRKRKLDSDASSRGGQVAQGNVFFDPGAGSSRTGTPMTPPSAKKKWIDLNLDSSSDDDDNGTLLTLTAARERNLKEARKNAAPGTPTKRANPLVSPPRAPQRKLEPSSSMSMLLNRTSTSTSTATNLGTKAVTCGQPNNPPASQKQISPQVPSSSSSSSSSMLPSSATGTDTRPTPSGQPAPKKGKFIDLNDSE